MGNNLDVLNSFSNEVFKSFFDPKKETRSGASAVIPGLMFHLTEKKVRILGNKLYEKDKKNCDALNKEFDRVKEQVPVIVKPVKAKSPKIAKKVVKKKVVEKPQDSEDDAPAAVEEPKKGQKIARSQTFVKKAK